MILSAVRFFFLVSLAPLLLVSTVHAADNPDGDSSIPRSAIRESAKDDPVAKSPEEEESRLTKNWGGARKDLSDRGIDIAVIYKWDAIDVFSGGLAESSGDSTTTLGNLDLRFAFDLDKLAGWSGMSLFIYGLGNHGGDPTALIGDFQATSNIETRANTFKLYEAWVQKISANERLSILFGLHDLNSEFYVTESSTLLLNSSFGVGHELAQTGLNGPSIFPTTSPAIRVKFEGPRHFYGQVGMWGAVAGAPENPYGTHVSLNVNDGFLLISEFAYHNPEAHSGKYAIGAWTYTRAPEDAPELNRGYYFLVDQPITDAISAFARFGHANSEANPTNSNLAGGFHFNGPIPGRERDRFGIGFTRVTPSIEDPALTSAETTLEAIYRFEPTPGLAIQPDLQYVIHPSADPSIPNATVGAVRFELSF